MKLISIAILMSAWSLYSSDLTHQFATTTSDPSTALPTECFLHILTFCKIADLATCTAVSKQWQKIAEDDSLWIEKCHERLRLGEKLDRSRSLKTVYRNLVQRPTMLGFLATERLEIPADFDEYNNKYPMRLISERVSETLTIDELGRIINRLLESRPAVICSVFGPINNNLIAGISDVLTSAKNLDVLMVLSGGHGATNLTDQDLDKSLHVNFPNILLVTAHKDQMLSSWANYGEQFDLAANEEFRDIKGSAASAIEVALFATYLRSLKPNLSAEEIRRQLIESSDKTEESKDKFPNGGIFNAEQAKAFIEP